MKFLFKILFLLAVNAATIWALSRFIEGFNFNGGLKELVIAAFVLTAINAVVRPFLKLIFGPFLVITFGLFVVVINGLTLYLLDILSPAVTIEGLISLLWAAAILTLINLGLRLTKILK